MILLIGDVHLSDRAPSYRQDTYVDEIIAKLEFTTQVAVEQDVESVVFAGDLFHLKAPTRTSHALVQRVLEVMKAYGRPVYVTVGNHDVQHDRLESIARQPLGVLFRSGVAEPLEGENGVLFGIPWLHDWADELPPYMRLWRESASKLMVTHAPLVRPGQSRPYEVISAMDWASLMDRPGDVYYGHMHMLDGAFEVVDDDRSYWFCNQGALSRGSLHESDLTRKPAVTLWQPGTDYPFHRVEVPHLPASEVFRLADKEAEVTQQDRLDEFLDSIGRTTLESVSIEKIISDLRDRGLRKEVLDEVSSLFESV